MATKDLSSNELKNFFEQLAEFELEIEIKAKQDAFLDVYQRWLLSRDPELMERVNTLAKELMKIDHSFKFKLLS